MLSSIRLTNDYGNRVDMNVGRFGGPKGYRIIDIQGLGPPPADINHSNYALLDGAIFHTSRSQARNLVITVEFENQHNVEGEEIEHFRRRLYKAALPKEKVRLDFYNYGAQEMWIEGYVETHEPSIFSKNPQVQISILCTQPYFMNRTRVVYEDLSQSLVTFDYPGDTPTGFEAFFYLESTVTWVEVANMAQSPETIVRFRSSDTDMSEGRSVRVNTEPGRKDAVIRMSGTNDFLRRILGESTVTTGWPIIFPGTNQLRLRTSGGSASFTGLIRYYEKYGGF